MKLILLTLSALALAAQTTPKAKIVINVTDDNATTIGSVVAGGGSNKVMAWCDGTNWKIFAN